MLGHLRTLLKSDQLLGICLGSFKQRRTSRQVRAGGQNRRRTELQEFPSRSRHHNEVSYPQRSQEIKNSYVNSCNSLSLGGSIRNKHYICCER